MVLMVLASRNSTRAEGMGAVHQHERLNVGEQDRSRGVSMGSLQWSFAGTLNQALLASASSTFFVCAIIPVVFVLHSALI